MHRPDNYAKIRLLKFLIFCNGQVTIYLKESACQKITRDSNSLANESGEFIFRCFFYLGKQQINMGFCDKIAELLVLYV